MVTRRVAIPEGHIDRDSSKIELEIHGVTPLAEPGSIRASVVASSRGVSALSMILDVPSSGAIVGSAIARVRAVQLEVARLSAELATLRDLRARVVEATPDIRVFPTHDAANIRARFDTARSTSALIDELTQQIDARELLVSRELLLKQRALESAQVEANASSSTRGEGHPSYRVHVALDGTGLVDQLEITYVVAAARWWPLYTLRLSEGGRRAIWWLEALVTQCTGEDWGSVKLGLSTADLTHDARLPELASLRLGRAQAQTRKGYRSPPVGLDRVFAGYDRFAPSPREEDGVVATRFAARAEDTGAFAAYQGGEIEEYDEDARFAKREEALAGDSNARLERLASAELQLNRESLRRQMPARQLALSPPVPMAQPSAMPPPASRSGGSAAWLLGAPIAAAVAIADALTSSDMASPSRPSLAPAELVPGAAWLDFDTLELAAPPLASRGSLVRASLPASVASAISEARASVEAVSPPTSVRDPREARGQFDHRHVAEGQVDIPSTPTTHRIVLASAPGSPSLGWVTAPRITSEVFREVVVTNPFETPLLAGPVDVYVDGSFLITSSLETIDRGGSARLGLGVEERIRVARNVRVDEGTTGLLGGTSEVVHSITIELASSLGFPARVTVLERVPVTDEKNLEVRVIETRPEAEKYDQSERGVPVRGGLRWVTELAAGAKTQLTLRYRLSFPTKNEVVGGNRREA